MLRQICNIKSAGLTILRRGAAQLLKLNLKAGGRVDYGVTSASKSPQRQKASALKL